LKQQVGETAAEAARSCTDLHGPRRELISAIAEPWLALAAVTHKAAQREIAGAQATADAF
jgi:hypothetical protein